MREVIQDMSDSRIAVIAIHGVGDHQPFEMARAVGDMLEDLEDNPRQPRYSAFSEDWVRLNVAPVKVESHVFAAADSDKESPQKGSGTWGSLDELFESKRKVQDAAKSEADSLDHLFMQGQLAEYKGEGPEETYEVLRLKGWRYKHAPVGLERESEPATSTHFPIQEREIHIYDMFWSDLSAVGRSGFRIFGELYQILFHLGSVGVHNVNAAAITLRETPAGKAWSWFAKAQKWAAALLAMPLPILNLIMLAFATALVLIGILTRLSAARELITVALVFFATLVVARGRTLLRKERISVAAFRTPIVLLPLAFTAVSIFAGLYSDWLNSKWSETIEVIAALMIVIGALKIVRMIVSIYAKHRPGADKWLSYCLVLLVALILAKVLALTFVPALRPKSYDFFAMTILLALIELTFWALALVWLLFWLAFVLAFLSGYWAVRRTKKAIQAEADRAARTNWTARLTLALPATLFLVVTFAVWLAILSLSLPLLPHHAPPWQNECLEGSVRSTENSCSVLCYSPLFPWQGKCQAARDWAWNSLFQAGGGFAPPFLLLICAAGIISIWGLTPSVLKEIFPPRGVRRDAEHEATALGNWLDNGYRFMRWAGRLIYFGVSISPLAVAIPFLPEEWKWVKDYRGMADSFLKVLGTMVAGAGLGILGLGGRLSKLALGFRPIVRVALDVDNWLRQHPRDANPTARICGRYISLLRYIGQWRNEQGKGYDALIIFAHSQGTVVTADLLRFLEVERRVSKSYAAYDGTLAKFDRLNRYLFTVGCPLRQLYSLRFPYLYGYASAEGEEDLLPSPQDLGIRQWMNVYRTGDYIGRYLWRPHPWRPVGTILSRDWDPPQGIPANIWEKEGRIEFSIGPGAHTHYWDSTAEPVAETLDVLIARA